MGCWGEGFFQVKNTFLLIKIPRRCAFRCRIKFATGRTAISLSPYLPTSQAITFESDFETALPVLGG
ncbi:MAG: hypothetical protein F6J94_14755 [Moorea sp. SIO1F2]|uniref:hypothetical protein n=1 Tax=Moorena TaxID=1155738 RepID=UPI0013BBF90E|nr:hypothetical protein [Moorena sp. SIO1F2]NET83137.1 hypothetical protein [Moorena sp. SIO1F2]